MNRKTLIIWGALLIFALALVACKGETVVETIVVEKEGETITVVETVVVEKEGETIIETVEVEKEVMVEVPVEKQKVIYNSMHGDPDPRAADEEIVKNFMEANPDIEVVHSIVAHEDFKQAIRAYLTASTPPDVMTWFAGNRARFFIDNGQIMDISDVWESEGWNESYPKGFQALSTVDGKQYFLPTSWYWWAVYYRVSIFEELGLEPPETWDEFLAVNETLKENGYIPIAIGTKYRWTAAAWFDYLNMRINGPQFHIDLMLGKEKYDDPRVAEVFEYWRVLLDNGYFLEDAAAYSWSEALEPMIAGEAAMYLMGDFIRDSLPDEIESDVDFFRFPIIDPSVPIGEDAPTDGYFLAANATNTEAAKKFLAYLGSVEVQTYNAEKLGRLPTNSGVDRSMFTETQQKGMELIDGADFVAQFYDRDTTPEMADEGMNAMMAFWDDPDSIDSLLADLELARQEIFEAE
jgi:multiple sugar transport system substrate-binding protein/raffinose/stachyose/melibiose transport system substrate-binding protein